MILVDDEIMESVSSDEEMVSTISSGKIHKPPFEVVGAEAKRYKPTLEAKTPRFQLFSALVHVNKYSSLDKNYHRMFSLFGWIGVSDPNVSSRDNGWVPQDDPDIGHSVLFFRDWHEPLPIINDGYINILTHPKTLSSIPVHDFIDINTDLHMFNTDDDVFFQVSNQLSRLSLSDDIDCDKFLTHTLSGADGYAELVYIVLSDSVDATVEITFKDIPLGPDDDVDDVYVNPLNIRIVAYYGGDNDCGCSAIGKGYFNVTLVNEDSLIMSDNQKVTLTTSVLAVPANSSLVIDAYLVESTTGAVVMNDIAELPVKHKGSSNGCIDGLGCRIEVNVNWKY